MDKEKIKQAIYRKQEEIIEDLEESRDRLETSADIDENETSDPEDYSRQNEMGSMATRLKFMLEKAINDLDHLKSLDLNTGDSITEGSLVDTDKYAFYVAIAVPPFDVDGKHIVSVSVKAPIYEAMRGKSAGETFSVAGNTYEIKNVY